MYNVCWMYNGILWLSMLLCGKTCGKHFFMWVSCVGRCRDLDTTVSIVQSPCFFIQTVKIVICFALTVCDIKECDTEHSCYYLSYFIAVCLVMEWVELLPNLVLQLPRQWVSTLIFCTSSLCWTQGLWRALDQIEWKTFWEACTQTLQWMYSCKSAVGQNGLDLTTVI